MPRVLLDTRDRVPPSSWVINELERNPSGEGLVKVAEMINVTYRNFFNANALRQLFQSFQLYGLPNSGFNALPQVHSREDLAKAFLVDLKFTLQILCPPDSKWEVEQTRKRRRNTFILD